MDTVVIVGAVRTAIGTFGGSLKELPVAEIGATAYRAAVERAGLRPEDVEAAVIGNVTGQVGSEVYLNRTVAVGAGFPVESTAYCVNRQCGSGLQAINSGCMEVALGNADVVVAGGVESMSRVPFISRQTRWGARMGHAQLEDGLMTALSCPFNEYHMGVTAENVAEQWGISREEQDRFALSSQSKAVRAIEEGRFREQIVPMPVPAGKGKTWLFDTDEHVKSDATLESLGGLRPVFKPGGSVTAGNASGINDGAAAVVLTTASRARALGLKPLAEIVGYAVAGVEPRIMGVGPVPAIRKVLKQTGLTLKQIDLIELNEAFAAQSLAVGRELEADGWDWEKVNPNGGAIALGHPVGASGAIITVKLLTELRRTQKEFGIASLCIGGGQGIATLFRLLA